MPRLDWAVSRAIPSTDMDRSCDPFRGPAGIGLLINGHEAHYSHKPSDALFIGQMTAVAQVPSHLLDPEERRFQKLLVDLTYQHQVHRRLAFGLVVK